MSKNKKQLVSVIMPAYNRAYIIERAINSVLEQTYDALELLIIDDGSTDETEAIVKGNIKDSRVKYIKLEGNHGACYARNQGLANAKGEYIAFLDTDNVWMKNYLEERIAVLKNSDADIGGVFGFFTLIANEQMVCQVPSKEVGEMLAESVSNDSLIKMMLFDNVIDTNTMVLKRCCAQAIDGFNENIMRLQDWEYFFRVLYYSGYRIIFQNNCLVTNYVQKDSISSSHNNKAYWDTKIFFIEKYKDVMKKYNCLSEVIVYLLYKKEPSISRDDVSRLLNSLGDSSEDIIVQMRETFLNEIAKYKNKAAREKMIIDTQSKWLELKQRNVSIGTALRNRGYNKIAIYGYGILGKLLFQELTESQCEVIYIIDRKIRQEEVQNLPMIRPDQEIPVVDAVIVTAVYDFEEIKRMYEKTIPYISIKMLLDEV